MNPNSKADTCIIIPCYNEADRLDADTIEAFCIDNPNIDVLFINDGSTDQTLELLQNLNQAAQNASFKNIQENSGKAEAVRTGFLDAIPLKYKYIGYFDADLSTPLDEVVRLKEIISSNSDIDIAIGSRVKMLGYNIDRSVVRHLVGRVFATLASITLNLPVYDTQCGAKLFVNNNKLNILFNDRFINRWTFDVEIIKRQLILSSIEDSATHGIEEMPLRRWEDRAGSRVKPVDFFIAIKDMAKISYHYNRKDTLDHYTKLLRKIR